MASIKAVLFKNKRLSSGKFPLAIRISKNRKTRYLFVGHYIEEKDWNENSREVKRSHNNSRRLNLLLKQKETEAESAILEYENKEKEFNLDQIKKRIKKRSAGVSFNDFSDDYLSHLIKEQKFKTASSSEQSRINNFKNFNSNKIIQFYEIDVALLVKFKSWLKEKGLADKTVNNHFIMIRTLFNRAIREGLIEREYYPFGGRDKIQLKRINTLKIGLDQNELNAIRCINLVEGSGLWHARNAFLLSFNFAGVRIGDLIKLTWRELLNNRLHYKMGKTGETVSIPISEEARRILSCYKAGSNGIGDYVLPFLKNANQNDPEDIQRKSSNATSVINKKLKSIAKLADIEKPLSSHIARHTFGNIASDRIPIPFLQKLYRHQSLNTTAIYQGNFIHRDTDDALLKVINF